MAAETVTDQELILKEIFELSSFNQKLSQPKASNWFAWNAMTKEHMREFTATKCVFAETYCDDPDPDDEGPFDAVTKDPKAQLQAILKGGAGACFQTNEDELIQARENHIYCRGGVLDLVHT